MADSFERHVLTFQARELVMISVLVALMPESHLGIGLRNGLTEAQPRYLIALAEATVDTKEAAAARVLLAQVLETKKQ